MSLDCRVGPSAATAAPAAGVDPSASIGDAVDIHRLARVCEHARVGTGSTLDARAYVGPSVIIGRHCRIHEDALVHESTLIEDGVCIGPAAVLANGTMSHPGGTRIGPSPAPPVDDRDGDGDYLVGVTVRTGAIIGAHAVCLAPATIGRWAVVVAGSVVTADVPDYALVAGAPARRVGWVGRTGTRLELQADGTWLCASTGERYRENDGILAPLTES